MGELHFGQAHSAAPIWELANLVDLTKWTWKPPSSAAPAPRSSQDTDTAWTQALSDAISNIPRSLFPPRTDGTEGPHELDGILLPQNSTLSRVSDHSTPLDVIAAALESISRDIRNGTTAISHFSRFCDSWRQALVERLFHGEAIGIVLAGIMDGLDEKSLDAHGLGADDQLKLLLMDATIAGVSMQGTDQSTSFDHVVWNVILHGVSRIGMNNIRIFAKAIACVPECSLEAMSPGILENLDVYFDSLGRAPVHSTLVRQSAKMAVPLRGLGKPELRFILDDASQMAFQYTDKLDVDYVQVRFSWLLLLARIPGVDEEYLAKTCLALEVEPARGPLTEPETCQLFLTWANCQTPFKKYDRLHRILQYDYEGHLELLGIRLWDTGQFHRVKLFEKFLSAIGREASIPLLVKGVSNPGRRNNCRLAGIALRMRRPRAAIDISCLYEENRKYGSSFWDSRLGFEALEILMWVPGFNFRSLWKELRILSVGQFRRWSWRARIKALDRTKKTKIAAVGIVAALSPHITRRKAFSLLTSCYLNLRRHNSRIPTSVVQALVHSATRHLADGQAGITSRLRYVLYITQQQLGRAEAERIAVAMARRRRANFGLRPQGI